MRLCAYRLKAPHTKALLLNPPQGEAVRKEPVFRTGERWNVVNNMNGEKK